jgi:LPS O-antigen subunit length determinant protein (WzzB/FepE family)
MTDPKPALTVVPVNGATQNIAIVHEQWFSLLELGGFFLRKWWVFSLVASLAGLLGLVYLRSTPVYYQATMIINSKDTSGLQGQDSGSLLDVLTREHSKANKKLDQFIDLMQMEPVIGSLDRKHALVRQFYGNLWNAETQSWIPPTGTQAVIRQNLRTLAGRQAWQQPGLPDLMTSISGNFKSEPLQKSGFFRLSYQSADPAFAAFMLQSLFQEANEFQRADELETYRKRLDYLEKRLAKTSDVFHRREIQQMINSIETGMMVAFVDETIAVDVIAPVSVPDRPAGPRLGKTLALSIMLGLLIASGGVYAWFMLRYRKRQR